jgi:hypothetical protein
MPHKFNEVPADVENRCTFVDTYLLKVKLNITDTEFQKKAEDWRTGMVATNFREKCAKTAWIRDILSTHTSLSTNEISECGGKRQPKCADTPLTFMPPLRDSVIVHNRDSVVVHLRDSVVVREQTVRAGIPWKPILVTIAVAGVVVGGLCLSDILDCDGDENRATANAEATIYDKYMNPYVRPLGNGRFMIGLQSR